MELDVARIISNLVKKTGMRLTSQRKTILEILIMNTDQHLSTKEIYLMAKDKDKSIGIATVYRNIDVLEKMHIVDKRNFGDDVAKYEFASREKAEHHHLICNHCGKVIEISGLLPDDLYNRLLEEKNFQFVDHSLKIYGYCQNCRIRRGS